MMMPLRHCWRLGELHVGMDDWKQFCKCRLCPTHDLTSLVPLRHRVMIERSYRGCNYCETTYCTGEIREGRGGTSKECECSYFQEYGGSRWERKGVRTCLQVICASYSGSEKGGWRQSLSEKQIPFRSLNLIRAFKINATRYIAKGAQVLVLLLGWKRKYFGEQRTRGECYKHSFGQGIL